MTVELDREKGPQIRVDQGKESAAFLNLFNGKMVIHEGGRHLKGHFKEPRLYTLRGETIEEACLVEVPLMYSSLRSKGAFVLIDYKIKAFSIWTGKRCPLHKKEMAKSLVKTSYYTITEHYKVDYEAENSESASFIKVLGQKTQSTHNHVSSHSDLENKTDASSVRMYRMTSVSGEFHVNEVLCPFRKVDVPNCLPFNQEDLYGTEQPGTTFVIIKLKTTVSLACSRS